MEGGCAQGFCSPDLLEPPHVPLLKSSATCWGLSSGISHQMHQGLLLSTQLQYRAQFWVPGLQVRRVTFVIRALENRKRRRRLEKTATVSVSEKGNMKAICKFTKRSCEEGSLLCDRNR